MDNMLKKFLDPCYQARVVEHLKVKNESIELISLCSNADWWALMVKMIEVKAFKFGPSIEGYVDKLTGKGMSYEAAKQRNFKDVRKIYMFEESERPIAHMIYLIFYDEYIKLSDKTCVSYKQKLGINKVSKRIRTEMRKRNYPDGFKTDIRHYFDNVNLETIEKLFISIRNDSPLWDLVWDLYHDDRVLINGEMVHQYKSLIQGCALACLWANLILKDVDETLKKTGIYYRYSDDIIYLGNDWKHQMKVLEQMLATKGLELHPEKKQELHPRYESFDFLGFAYKRDTVSVAKKTLKGEGGIEHKIKTSTVSITRKNHKGATESELKQMIRSLQRYFFTAYAKNNKAFGMGVYLFGNVTSEKDIITIDEYCKDCLRAAYTNKTHIYGLGWVGDRNGYMVSKGLQGNINGNNQKTGKGTDDDLLKRLGWVSLHHMWKLYLTDKDVFRNEVNLMANGINTFA